MTNWLDFFSHSKPALSKYVQTATSQSPAIITIGPGLQATLSKDEENYTQISIKHNDMPNDPVTFNFDQVCQAQFSGKNPREKTLDDLRQDLLFYINMRIQPGSANWFGDNRFDKLEQASKLLKLIDYRNEQDIPAEYTTLYKLHPGRTQLRSIAGEHLMPGMLSELAYEISLKKIPIKGHPHLWFYREALRSTEHDFKHKYPFTASQCQTIMSGLYKLVGSNDQLTLIYNNDQLASYQFENLDLHTKLKQQRGYDVSQEANENDNWLRQVEGYIVDRCQRCYNQFRTADTRSQKLSLAIRLANWVKRANDQPDSTISNALINQFHREIYQLALKLDMKQENGHLKADGELGQLIEKIGPAYLGGSAPDIRQVGKYLEASLKGQHALITHQDHRLPPLQYQFSMIDPKSSSNNHITLRASLTNSENSQLLIRVEAYLATRIQGNSTQTSEKHYNKLNLAIKLAHHLHRNTLDLETFNDIHQRASDLDCEQIGCDRFPAKGLGQEICHIGHTLFSQAYQQRINTAQIQENEFHHQHSRAMAHTI